MTPSPQRAVPREIQASTAPKPALTSFDPSAWRTPAGLVALTALPALVGMVQLIVLSPIATSSRATSHGLAAPLPVMMHLVGAGLFCLLAIFQLSASFRRWRPDWHRTTEKTLAPWGLAAALSGLWMTQFYPLPNPSQGPLLYGFQLTVGSGMVLSVLLSLAALLQAPREPTPEPKPWPKLELPNSPDCALVLPIVPRQIELCETPNSVAKPRPGRYQQAFGNAVTRQGAARARLVKTPVTSARSA